MRILRFKVDKQRITKQKDCDFSGIVAGSVGYLRAAFEFSEDWNKCETKIARFWNGENEHSAFLNSSNECEIPPEALTNEIFKVSVLGVAPSFKIDTNKIKVRQEVN